MLRLFYYILLIGILFFVVYPSSYSDVIAEPISNCQSQIISALDFDGFEHNCRLWAVISNNIADSVIYNQLIAYPRSLKNLSGYINTDGWGIAFYQNFGDSSEIGRGALRALLDPAYDSVVVSIDSLKPDIILAHIRNWQFRLLLSWL